MFIQSLTVTSVMSLGSTLAAGTKCNMKFQASDELGFVSNPRCAQTELEVSEQTSGVCSRCALALEVENVAMSKMAIKFNRNERGMMLCPSCCY